MNPILTLDQISFSYHSLDGETAALENINFQVMKGEFVAIVGPSGCGKSTLLSLICGLIEPESGTIRVDGASVGYMLQKDHLLEWRTVYDNVTLGLEIQHKLTPENKEKVLKMLKTYGLEHFKRSAPSELSGGMRQRAALIRTLALEPDILLLDEPFSALDYQTRLEVGDDIGSIIRNAGKTAILVTHDLSEAVSMGDRVIILSHRPGTIKKIMPITFEEKGLSPMQRRNTKEFHSYFNQIWKELKGDGEAVGSTSKVSAERETS
ncbi:ABC transporter ATP-binding protein [Lachnotalea sp. AF33-28]|jgi:NitT/TauT family transport system ATP-binding protein|uniref:ABC transporter ATP-binding protein n=1 Tax=Lachnotalea sp. AF33-28 TaxID=2292046 RepID=UPI000E531F43|nr:ABC transporter ATP-binding protein [Lachnotalea sp. AF33-28]RHP30560.1 ABC transporter ATP-binding protein [Lachnotalea sp. AF33-28]